jgi:putative DNA primase/helicase
LAGYTAEQIFVFGHGTGSNGKGVLIHVMVAVLEGYTGRMEATFVCGSMPDPDSPTPTKTRVQACRFVYISENVEAAKLNEQLFKCLSGEEIMVYRPLHGEQREFMPEFKFLMVCNSLPEFNGSDYAMKRRIRVIPFVSAFVEANENPDPAQNRYLKDKTFQSRVGSWKHAVLGALIEGYRLYRDEGLSDNVPEAMIRYTEDYMKENDVIKMFIDEAVEFGDGALAEFKTGSSEVYDHFKLYHGKNASKKSKMSGEKDFVKRFMEGCEGKVTKENGKCTEKWGRKTTRFYQGVKLKPLDDDVEMM